MRGTPRVDAERKQFTCRRVRAKFLHDPLQLTQPEEVCVRLSPIRLRPDNFTPPTRTPWGGTRLLGRYKRGLGITSVDPSTPVGESWELSSGEEYPSLTESGERLADALRRDPPGFLGEEAREGREGSALLVKWLDAADGLSVQIHPEDDYRGLAPGEAGKLECWYIVDHEPGAGLYFGFLPGTTRDDVRRALERHSDLSRSMNFIPVARGDFFVLEPGTPHAVGRGMSLIEPQTVKPGHRGLTYRYFDFGRRYDPTGRPDAAGAERALHVADALAVTRWDRACDRAWLDSRRLACGTPDLAAPPRCEGLLGAPGEARIENDNLRVARIAGTGVLKLPAWNALRGLTVIEGEVAFDVDGERHVVPAGSTVAIPAALGGVPAELSRAHAIVSAARAPVAGG